MNVNRINYKSNFKLLIELKNYTGEDYVLTFTTTNTIKKKYTCSFVNGVYKNCSKVDNTHIICNFDSGVFRPGLLTCEVKYSFHDLDTSDKKYKIVSNDLVVAYKNTIEYHVEITKDISDAVNTPEWIIHLLGPVLKNECPFEIDDNGILLNKKNGKRYILTPYHSEPVLIRIEYSEPDVEIVYPDIQGEGGTSVPQILYSQRKIEYYSDGSMVDSSIKDGATITFEGADDEYGSVTAPTSSSEDRYVFRTVTITLSLNDKTVVKEINIYQDKKPVMPYLCYIGNTTATKASFTTLSVDDLLLNIRQIEVSKTLLSSFTATQNCFFLLVPDEVTLASCYYISGGIRTDLTLSDFNLTHEDVVIDNKQYKVHGYRFNGVSNNNPLTYNFKLLVK